VVITKDNSAMIYSTARGNGFMGTQSTSAILQVGGNMVKEFKLGPMGRLMEDFGKIIICMVKGY
jgi:hypothetical protein